MEHFSFVHMENLDFEQLNNLELRFEQQETVVLASEVELSTLVKLFGSRIREMSSPSITDVKKSFTIDEHLMPMSEDDFDAFYSNWLQLTKRGNNMDEYGQLLHLNSFFQARVNRAEMVILSEAI
uniref:hypothetical protein n=1 Tax=Ningiella ruwaisensis TaxID=2364274 RepID=UPI00109FE6A5|nr:hypothetical protein [Ningiella ruwaisensis]